MYTYQITLNAMTHTDVQIILGALAEAGHPANGLLKRFDDNLRPAGLSFIINGQVPNDLPEIGEAKNSAKPHLEHEHGHDA